MIHALITQREEVNRYGDLVDSLEAAYIDYFQSLGICVHPVPNKVKIVEEFATEVKWDLLILTGGGFLAESCYYEQHEGKQQINRDLVETKLILIALKDAKPIVGICRGMQQLNCHYGGMISKLNHLNVERKVRIEHPVKLDTGEVVMVNNYHTDGIFAEGLGTGLKIIAADEENGVVEAIRGEQVLGIQWHPERMQELDDGRRSVDRMILKMLKV